MEAGAAPAAPPATARLPLGGVDRRRALPAVEEVARLLHAAVDALERAGATVARDARPDFTFEYASRVYDQLLGAAQCGGFSTAEIEEMAARVAADARPRDAALTLRHRAWLSANERRLQMRRKWL